LLGHLPAALDDWLIDGGRAIEAFEIAPQHDKLMQLAGDHRVESLAARGGRVLLGTGLGRPQNGAAKHAERRQWRRSDKRPPTNPTQRNTSPAEP